MSYLQCLAWYCNVIFNHVLNSKMFYLCTLIFLTFYTVFTFNIKKNVITLAIIFTLQYYDYY